MAREPARRYPTAAALRDDLERFLDGRPILGRPVPAWQRALGWARRRPAVAALLSLVIVLACGLLGGVASWASSLSWHNRQLEIHIARANAKAAEAEKAQQVAQERQQHADAHRVAASLRRAREALDARQIELAQDILHEISPELGENAAAGFAWGYLWRQATRDFTQLWGHEATVDPPLISANGTMLVTRDVTGQTLVWNLRPDMPPDRPQAALAIPHPNDGVLRLVLSSNGHYLASTTRRAPVAAVVFDTATGRLLMRLSGDPSSRLIASDFDGESRRLLLLGENASREPKILWWEIGREASVPHSRPLGAPAYIVAPPCIGRNIAAFVDKENKVKLYDPLTGELEGPWVLRQRATWGSLAFTLYRPTAVCLRGSSH